jgi:hypothetical protein
MEATIKHVVWNPCVFTAPDKRGKFAEIVRGHDSLDRYLNDSIRLLGKRGKFLQIKAKAEAEAEAEAKLLKGPAEK